MSLSYLKRYKRIYLASPYTLFPRGLSAAYAEVGAITGQIAREGICVFSPIVHGHALVLLGWLDAMDQAFWADQNRFHQDGCNALVIAKMDGWEQSDGIKAEFAQAVIMKQPIYYLDPATMRITVPE